MRLVAGIDVGSAFTKAVLLAESADLANRPEVLARGTVKTGVDLDRAAHRALEAALNEIGFSASDVAYVATTGFGRYSVSFRDIQITDITTGAHGAWHLFPLASGVLDIGSQSTRAITLTGSGKVRQFKTNDKCAAGSGSFIVRAAKYLQVKLEGVGEMALNAKNPQPISSVCAVLAESEIINHVSAGVSVEDIVYGIYDSLADRASMLLKRAGSAGDLIFIGGVARQQGMVQALENRLKVKVHVPYYCEHVCALGAALLGMKRVHAAHHSPPSLKEPGEC
ncbi:MAG: acyl-CoA dehydratase activase [Candidatus Acidiferrales bacterium]